jgi:hypothetical protein
MDLEWLNARLVFAEPNTETIGTTMALHGL